MIILSILIALIIALLFSYFQYLHKVKNNLKLNLFLAFFRFCSLFLILLLLINPVITKKSYEVEKTHLPIIIDNSQSIEYFKQGEIAKNLSNKIAENSNIKKKYNIQLFSFDKDFDTNKEIDFKGTESNIFKVFENLKQLYRVKNYPLVLLTDGNQTHGTDYVYNASQNTNVFPIVLGDTIQHLDIKISQLNANKYAFLKNKFPVEVFINYTGKKTVNAELTIQSSNTIVHKQNVSFSATKKSQMLTALINADRVGVHTYKATISLNENEKNKFNNVKNFAVEVIDQRTEIALISSITHPDLGAIKRAIETNSQRKVTILKPKDIKDLSSYNLLVLYQPNIEFKSIFDSNKNLKINHFLITGVNTDYNFLQQNYEQFDFKVTNQKEDFSADFNSNFNLFSINNLGFEQFPPLENNFGDITPKMNVNTVLKSRIRNIKTENPLLCVSENGMKRNAFLFGENIWKWRMESYLKEKSFDKFDQFMDKIIQYLASNSKKKNLIVTHENFYNEGETIQISAQYFNKNYEFDVNGQLTINLKHKESNSVKIYDFVKGENDFSVVFDNLEAGNYSFVVKEKKSGTQYIGNFHIIDFNAEKQFINADLPRLKQLAENTQGKIYFPTQIDELIKSLEENQNFQPVQKEIVKKSPLIDWVWGLILIAIFLSVEWFVRKYYGLL